MDILAVAIIVLGVAICRYILERAQERARSQDALLMRLIHYKN